MANKKITWKNFIANMPQDTTATIELNPEVFGVESIEVKRTLDMDAMSEFVGNVVAMCIDKDTAEYIPESYDFAIRLNVLNHYAGIPIWQGWCGAAYASKSIFHFI